MIPCQRFILVVEVFRKTRCGKREIAVSKIDDKGRFHVNVIDTKFTREKDQNKSNKITNGVSPIIQLYQ